jgi:hypothetical protein
MTDIDAVAERLYQRFSDEEDARVCKDIPDEACDQQPTAFVLQLLSQVLTKIGDALTSSRLVLAWLLSSLGAPAIYISLLVPLRESLSLLPQLIVAQAIRQHAVRKWFWVAGSVVQAIALGGMVAALLSLPADAAALAIVLLLALFSLARGVCSVAAKDVLGKTVSRTRRGRLTGLATSAAGVVTLAVAAILWHAPPSKDGDTTSFALMLSAAALLWLLAATLYARVPEVPGATEGGGNALTSALASLSLLGSDRTFRNFVVARILLVATAFAIPYIVVLIQRSGGSGLAGLAVLMAAEGAAGMTTGMVWGRWSDRAAHRVMAAAAGIAVLVMAITLVMASFTPDLLAMPLTGALILFAAATAHHGARVGRKTYLLDMATQDNRARYTAVSNTVMGLVLLSGAALGIVDTLFGTRAVLILLALVGLAAIARCYSLPHVDEAA